MDQQETIKIKKLNICYQGLYAGNAGSKKTLPDGIFPFSERSLDTLAGSETTTSVMVTLASFFLAFCTCRRLRWTKTSARMSKTGISRNLTLESIVRLFKKGKRFPHKYKLIGCVTVITPCRCCCRL